MPNDQSDKKMRRKSNLDLATVEDQQVTFISNHSGEKDKEEEQEESDTEMVNEQA